MRTRILAISIVLALGGCEAGSQGTEAPVAIEAEVMVSGGSIRGLVGENGLKQFHAIPFAAPPVGDLRWAPPVPLVAWKGVRDATSPGPACMQPQGRGGLFYSQEGFAMD